MIFATPQIDGSLERRLDELAQLRERLGSETGRSLRWIGTLRRLVRATAVESSTSIEGFSVDPDDAVALVSGDARPSADDENQLAVASYGRAMRHVAAMAADPRFRWSERVLLDLHFDACEFQDDKDPGLWRGGPISVTGPKGRIAYSGPDAEMVPDLMAEATDWMERGDLDAPAVVRAAMAHLHVVAIHPFRDGNGRVARIAQSLVLARDGLVSFEFASIEEYLGERTQDYYDVLERTQGGSYKPERSAREWVEFCVEAHLDQAQHRLDQIAAAGARWTALETIAEKRGWPERMIIALEQSLVGGTDRGRYAGEADVSHSTASADLRRLVDGGLLEQRGLGRNSRYIAADVLRREIG
ncbi:MAG TPA: Fic family protein [Thermoleophilaceae bacterium]|nr:Fic family protein [Thermoleophilaceae bacterium]